MLADTRPTLHRSDVDLTPLVRQLVERHQPLASGQGCALSVRAETPVVANVDQHRLEQVMVNLLSNAIKFGHGKPVLGVGGRGGRLGAPERARPGHRHRARKISAASSSASSAPSRAATTAGWAWGCGSRSRLVEEMQGSADGGQPRRRGRHLHRRAAAERSRVGGGVDRLMREPYC